ncbi:Protein CBG04866 [Caenorhabditis briggsae]|uniref:Glycosyltransferase family 92 protein n=1 Tax=Caenorhabditis briggsae TaxID=6238 RepID=A8WYN6_CAEBR|nr:Protein CBG04866 [Caenorhabditis briggsae]CAP25494.2 Protein CBG04866 [Caenorhabditis briggsae]
MKIKRKWKFLLTIVFIFIAIFIILPPIIGSNDQFISWYQTFRHKLTILFLGDPATSTDAYIINTYYYPRSKSLGENAIAMVLLLDRNTVRDITRYQMKLVATNGSNQSITVHPTLIKEQLNEACRLVNVVATTNVLPEMKKLEIFDGNTKVEIPFKLPRQSAPTPVIICISPQFIAEQWQLFVTHAHVARRFGGHLHIYITSMLDSFFELAQEYERLGYATIDFWMKLKFKNPSSENSLEPNSESELRNQAGAQTDCLLQYKEAAEFITFFDIDDILFPRGYDSYYDEFSALHLENPGILTFHYNKREMLVHNKANIRDFDFSELFGHTWFVNEQDYGKVMTKPTSINSMWIHESFNFSYKRKLFLRSNWLIHIQKPVDTDGKDIIPYRMSHFEQMPEMKLNDSVLVEIQKDFERLLNTSSILKIAGNLPTKSYYFPIIYRCYYEKFYKKFQTECPNGEGCLIPQRSDMNCFHSEADYKSGPKMMPITYHFHENSRWVKTVGCHN